MNKEDALIVFALSVWQIVPSNFAAQIFPWDIGATSDVATHWAAPTKLLGPQALTNHMWGPTCFLPQGPLGPSYATGSNKMCEWH